MRRYGNRLQSLAYRERRLWPLSSYFHHPSFFPISSMPRPRTLELAASGSSTSRKNFRSPRVIPSPCIKRGTWHQQQYLTNRKITHGPDKSKLVVHALQRRLLRRGLNSPRTRRKTFSGDDDSDGKEAPQPESPCACNLTIVLPQPPLLSLPCLYPETDSGYCSDASRSPSLSPQSEAPPRPMAMATRRYIRPDLSDPLAGSPSDLASYFAIRLSAHPITPSLRSVFDSEPFELKQ
ncbi:hypothetical protein B0H19DRAFT_1141078 [Mycena capillaripes]|nr:hypothetical protein B0H19DRAFT_1141078 [Mycena capillaripes]